MIHCLHHLLTTSAERNPGKVAVSDGSSSLTYEAWGQKAGHLAGNLTIYAGRDAFNSYAEHLHNLQLLVTVAEWGLLFFAVIHVSTGLVLFYQNFASDPNDTRITRAAVVAPSVPEPCRTPAFCC